MKNIKHLLLIALLVGLILPLAALAQGWQEPTSNPPVPNAPAPINVSVANQVKAGGLSVGTSVGGIFRAIYRMVVGGADNEVPSADLKLDVEGKVGATAYCDNNGQNCATPPLSGGTTGGGLPTGLASQTLRHDGTNWVASGNLMNDGYGIGIGGTAPVSGTALSVVGAMRLGSNKLQGGSAGQLWVANDVCIDGGPANGLCLSQLKGLLNGGTVINPPPAGTTLVWSDPVSVSKFFETGPGGSVTAGASCAAGTLVSGQGSCANGTLTASKIENGQWIVTCVNGGLDSCPATGWFGTGRSESCGTITATAKAQCQVAQ